MVKLLGDKMATEIYKKDYIYLFDGTEIELVPLKIKYLRDFMEIFNNIKTTNNDESAIEVLSDCGRVCMKQYYPELSKDLETFQDNIDIKSLYKLLEIAAGIKINKSSEESVKDQATKSQSWDDLDLAKLEAEVFLLGIWKDYDHLEKSLSMPELIVTLESKRELEYEEKKFLAAMQGVDLEAGNDKGQKEWEDMKARVFSKGATSDSNDVLALQGQNAIKAGFGIGMGLEYENLT